MHNYFAPQPGPAPAPEAQPAALPNLFPSGEREVRVPHHHGGTYRRVQSIYTGELRGNCGACAATSKDIAKFAPDENRINVRKRPAFFEALEAYRAAYEARDLEGAKEARATIDALRSKKCPPCRATSKKLTKMQKACRNCWIELRQEACARGGCMKEGCCEKGPNAWQVLEADHLVPADKVYALSDWNWWASHGGPAAMRAEAAKCQWLCRFCHQLEPTGDPGNRRGDPATMPEGKQGKHATEKEKKQYFVRHHAKIRYPKQAYVDAEKLCRGCCLTCERKVTPTTVFAFQFDHRDETTKMIGEATLAGENGGVAGLVANCAKRTALAKIKPVLDNEMAKCDLLCANCHKRKTCEYEDDEDDEE